MKIAVIVELTKYNKAGLYYAATTRVKSLIMNNPDFEIDVFNLAIKYPIIINLFHFIKNPKLGFQKKQIDFDGLVCQNLWVRKLSLLRYFLNRLGVIKKESIQFESYLKYFDNKDLIVAHYGNGPGEFALRISQLTSIPFSVTFHGSDIHTTPFLSPLKKELYQEMLSLSKANIFVSEGLMRESNKIIEDIDLKKFVIYNGCDNVVFKKSTNKEISELKTQIGLKGKVIGFVGNLVDVKNAILLPSIFLRIQQLAKIDICFLIVGDGVLKNDILKLSQQLGVDIKYVGRQPLKLMPHYHSLMDLLILPSKNEGLPLVLIEALACGTACVGSLTGGIPEVIGKEKCVSLDINFVENFALKCVEEISENVLNTNDICRFDVECNSILEGDIYRNIIKKNL